MKHIVIALELVAALVLVAPSSAFAGGKPCDKPKGGFYLVVDVIPNVTACSTFTVVARSVDGCGNAVSAAHGFAHWRDSSGSIQPAQPEPFVNGVSVTSDVIIPAPVTGNTLTISINGLLGTSNAFDVSGHGQFDHIEVAPIKTPQKQCKKFEFFAYARDACGNLVTSYDGDAEWSDLSGKLRKKRAPEFVDGVAHTKCARVKKKFKANRIKITSGGKDAESNEFDVIGLFEK